MELQWQKQSSSIQTCAHGKYTLKWKKVTGRDVYEVWLGETLEFNTGNYWQFLKRVTNEYKAGTSHNL